MSTSETAAVPGTALGTAPVIGAGLGLEPRVGVVGADVPRQIVLACGAVPARILGSWTGAVSQESTELLGATDAVAARVLNEILSGAHDELAGLVVCNDSMADLRVYYVLRILAERGRVPFPVHFLDAPRGGGDHRRRFVSHQYERLAAFTSGITGHQADATSLAGAAAREAELGAALEAVRGRRREGVLSGTTALTAYRAAAQLSPEDALERITDLVRSETLDRGASEPVERDGSAEPAAAGVPVYVTGSSHPDATVYTELEAAGAIVVGEDHDAGDAAWIGDTVTAATLAEACAVLAARHAARPPAAARSLSSERTDHLLAETERCGAAGVVALVRDLDDGPVWDLADHRPALAGRNLWLAEQLRVPAGGVQDAAAGILHTLSQNVNRKDAP
ncbi:2-hydroxyacyl-CoA dehydratase family protein [Citricoccus muralis]|uniref:2-hydroxyacyl-CoA dehydratase family protein n=1 Tax=Citricoccus muralis TaxID=169134 RepID=UPI0011C03729|nr:2-hydroxyacyl-CoA dehydratase family protein [Citricoccus muralis]